MDQKKIGVFLKELRKEKGLTQDDLAQALYVSRTAISKWESGRGYPNIESLKAIAEFFKITVDELLSGDELLSLAEADTKQKEKHIYDIVFGLLDCCALMLFFLPFFGQKTNGVIKSVSVLLLTEISSYLQILYFVFIITKNITLFADLHSFRCAPVRIVLGASDRLICPDPGIVCLSFCEG